MPIALIPRTNEIVLLQMDGHMTRKEFELAVELSTKACQNIHALQKEALYHKYSPNEEASATAPGGETE